MTNATNAEPLDTRLIPRRTLLALPVLLLCQIAVARVVGLPVRGASQKTLFFSDGTEFLDRAA